MRQGWRFIGRRILSRVGLQLFPLQARFSLKRNNGDPNAAAEWLFGHADEVPEEEQEEAPATQGTQEKEKKETNYRYSTSLPLMHSQVLGLWF